MFVVVKVCLIFVCFHVVPAARGVISNTADSGVASFDNWRGEYSYISLHRP